MKLRHHWTPVVGWHVRHVLVIWTCAHLALALALMFASGASPFRRNLMVELFGLDAGVVAMAMTIALAAYDRSRVGALHLLANFGYSTFWQYATTTIIAVVAESFLQIARLQWR